MDVRGNIVLLMDLARQQGLLDVNMIDDSDRLLLRLMMPVAKMFCGKKVVANASECIECFGGQVSSILVHTLDLLKNVPVTGNRVY